MALLPKQKIELQVRCTPDEAKQIVDDLIKIIEKIPPAKITKLRKLAESEFAGAALEQLEQLIK